MSIDVFNVPTLSTPDPKKPTSFFCSDQSALAAYLARYLERQPICMPYEHSRFANADQSQIFVLYQSGSVLCQGRAARDASAWLRQLVRLPCAEAGR